MFYSFNCLWSAYMILFRLICRGVHLIRILYTIQQWVMCSAMEVMLCLLRLDFGIHMIYINYNLWAYIEPTVGSAD